MQDSATSDGAEQNQATMSIEQLANVWKEWAYAKDNFGQHYYMERWERLEEGNSLRLALRKREGIDGIVVVVGVSASNLQHS